MASLLRRGKSLTIQFAEASGRRRTLPLGRVSKSFAEIARHHLEHLLVSRRSGHAMPMDTAAWLAKLDGDLHRRFADLDLVPARKNTITRLGDFLESFIAERDSLKLSTLTILRQARLKMITYFGAARDIRTITMGHASDWKREMERKLSGPTVATHVKKARQFFSDALDRKLIEENPFQKLKAGDQTNEDRLQYVSVETVQRVIDATPLIEWKVIFGLARFQGMRIPSESSRLRWSDIDWERNRMVITSPKTERYKGRSVRIMPIMPNMRPLLVAALEQAIEGEVYVLPTLRRENQRRMAEKYILRAGVEPWVRLFQNQRSSCETDLADKFPLYVVCKWIGNTEGIARRHYLQVREEHFEAASNSAAKSAATDSVSYGKLPTANVEIPQELHEFDISACPRLGSNQRPPV